LSQLTNFLSEYFFKMPFDVSIIQPFGQVSKVLPMTKTFTPRKLTTLDPEKLSTLLAKEKIAYKKSNIVFLDCQSWDGEQTAKPSFICDICAS
jgi:hypothetical protein